jgi:hypothetical protein
LGYFHERNKDMAELNSKLFQKMLFLMGSTTEYRGDRDEIGGV